MSIIKIKPTFEIVNEMGEIEETINMLMARYNELSTELLERFPILEKDEYFVNKEIKPKVKEK